MSEDRFKHGWRTMSDGSRVPLQPQDAADLHAAIQKIVADRAVKLPTAVAALSAVSEATERLRELGWSTIGPRDGEEKAMIQFGSTGMWHAFRHGDYYHSEDCVYGLRDKTLFFKPIDDLTDDERERVAYCVKNRPRYL
jgi:hypothetical protein